MTRSEKIELAEKALREAQKKEDKKLEDWLLYSSEELSSRAAVLYELEMAQAYTLRVRVQLERISASK